jgi:hypothetical protein
VGLDPLADERPVSVTLRLGPLDELPDNAPVALGLVPELARCIVEQALRKPDVALLLRHHMVDNHLVGVGTRLHQPLRRPVGTLHSVHASLPLSVIT